MVNTIQNKRTKQKLIIELIIILACSIIIFFFATRNDYLEKIVALSRAHENWELDEVIPVIIFLAIAMIVFSVRRLQELKISKKILVQHNEALENALSEIKQLRGIIPICSNCKKIRDDAGSWHQIESYVRQHTEAEFSHGICPDCRKKLYPELDIEDDFP